MAGYSGEIDRYKSELSGRNRSRHLLSATYLRRHDEKTVLSVRSAGESTRYETGMGSAPASLCVQRPSARSGPGPASS